MLDLAKGAAGKTCKLTLGKPLACAPMIVTSPGCGFGLSRGIYCLTANRTVSSCANAKARTYSLIYCPSTTCSLTLKYCGDMLAAGVGIHL
jgi:hypothetical protein